MADPVSWGILSTARINEKFLAGAALAEAVHVRAVASRDRRRARQYADAMASSAPTAATRSCWTTR